MCKLFGRGSFLIQLLLHRSAAKGDAIKTTISDVYVELKVEGASANAEEMYEAIPGEN